MVRLSAGPNSLQRLGDSPRRRYGVPPSGPLDALSHRLALALLGAPADAPTLEVLGVLELEAEQAMTVAVVGAATSVQVNGHPFPAQCALLLPVGGTLHVEPSERGLATYVALGALVEGELVAGKQLKVQPQTSSPGGLGAAPPSLAAGPLRFIPNGATQERADALREREFTVSAMMDRRGFRLEGAPMEPLPQGRSEPVVPGTIQLPPSGLPILLGPDGPTLGGYPSLGVICAADLPRMGQLRPGKTVRMESISMEEALRLKREQDDAIEAWELRLRSR